MTRSRAAFDYLKRVELLRAKKNAVVEIAAIYFVASKYQMVFELE
jgi:hypothetical protein